MCRHLREVALRDNEIADEHGRTAICSRSPRDIDRNHGGEEFPAAKRLFDPPPHDYNGIDAKPDVDYSLSFSIFVFKIVVGIPIPGDGSGQFNRAVE